MTCLGLEYFCFEGDGLWTSTDAELIALAKREIDKIGLIAEPTTWSTPAWCASPRPIRSTTTTTPSTSTTIRARAGSATIPNLHLVGRNGMHKYNNQDHAMMTAMLTAREHPGRRAHLRRLAGQRGRRIPRGGRVGRAGGAGERAAGAAQGQVGRPKGTGGQFICAGPVVSCGRHYRPREAENQMRELFDEVAGKSPLDPEEAVRRTTRGPQRKRFYTRAGVVESPDGFAITLDGKPVRTPSGPPLVGADAARSPTPWRGSGMPSRRTSIP